MIQGNCRYQWVEREFTEIKELLLGIYHSLITVTLYFSNQVFEAELELNILDSSDNIQEDDLSNSDDCGIDINFSKVAVEQDKPKPTCKKAVKKSNSAPLKRITKRRSIKLKLDNPNKRNGKPTNSDWNYQF